MSDTVQLSLNRSLADRYELSRELGQGGMATVYLARDLRAKDQHGLVVCPSPSLADDPKVGAFVVRRYLSQISW